MVCLSCGATKKGAIALTQGEGSWRSKTLVAKIRAIRSHLNAGYITISYIETTKMLADILAKFLGPNPTRDALGHKVLYRFIKKTDPAFHEWNGLHGYSCLKTFESWPSSFCEVITVIRVILY